MNWLIRIKIKNMMFSHGIEREKDKKIFVGFYFI